jgi:hypothetical protein
MEGLTTRSVGGADDLPLIVQQLRPQHGALHSPAKPRHDRWGLGPAIHVDLPVKVAHSPTARLAH